MKLDVFISIQDKIILILYKKVLILYISFPTKTAPGHIQNVKSCQACSVISIWNQLTNSSSFDDAIRSSANSMFGSLSMAERQLCYGIKNAYFYFSWNGGLTFQSNDCFGLPWIRWCVIFLVIYFYILEELYLLYRRMSIFFLLFKKIFF